MSSLAATIQIKYGSQEVNLPTLLVGELAFCQDTRRLWIGTNFGNFPLACGCEDIESSTPGESSSMTSQSTSSSASSLSSPSSLIDVSTSSFSSSSFSRSLSSSSSISASASSTSPTSEYIGDASSVSSVSGPCVDIFDSFGGAAMNLEDHVADTGQSWLDIHAAAGNPVWVINGSGSVGISGGTAGNQMALLHANNINGVIEVTVTTPAASEIGTQGDFICALIGRLDSPEHVGSYSSGLAFKFSNVEASGICVVSNGQFPSPIAASATTFAKGTSYTIRLELSGNDITVFVDGVLDCQATYLFPGVGTYWGMHSKYSNPGVLFHSCAYFCGGASEMSSSSSSSSTSVTVSFSSSSSSSSSVTVSFSSSSSSSSSVTVSFSSSSSSSSTSSASSSSSSSSSSNSSSSSSSSSTSTASSASSNSSSSSSSSTASSASSASSSSSSSSTSSTASSASSASSNSSSSSSSSQGAGGSLYFDSFTGTSTVTFTDINMGTTYTISCWIKDTNNTSFFLAKTGDSYNAPMALLYGSSARTYYSSTGGAEGVAYETEPTYTGWHHYAVTRQGTNVYFYWDGSSVGSATVDSSDTTVNLIGIYGGGGFHLEGYLHDFRIYAGATANITTIYNGGCPGEDATVGSVTLRYKFDDGSGTTANDSSGNNNDGTLANFEPEHWSDFTPC